MSTTNRRHSQNRRGIKGTIVLSPNFYQCFHTFRNDMLVVLVQKFYVSLQKGVLLKAFYDALMLLLLLFTRPLPRDGAWQKTMELQKPGNSPGSEPEVIKRQRVAKE